MLTIHGSGQRFCDGVSRRSFMKIGGLAMGGLTMPDLLQAESQSRAGSSKKSVIMIYLAGGPPHIDMVDLKPEAPLEIRGSYRPIETNVPGIRICEHLPRLAAMMDKLAVIRSVVGAVNAHASFQCMTGRSPNPQPQGGWPSIGSVASKLLGSPDPSVRPFVGLQPAMKNVGYGDPGQPGFLGTAHSAFRPSGPGMSDMVLNGITIDRLGDRKALLASLDSYRRQIDAATTTTESDTFTKNALSILTSSKLVEALDLEREDPRCRDRYGRGSTKPAGYGDAGPLLNDYFLAARRLIEAGVRVVTLSYGRWDWHGDLDGIPKTNLEHLAGLDQGVSALIEDLRVRGLDEDVSVIVWGEFGRTPRINKEGGRDHWPNVSCALLSGGGMRTGQVIGATNKFAEYPTERPVTFGEVFATLYHQLGIDVDTVTVEDLTGRPRYLVQDGAKPIEELI